MSGELSEEEVTRAEWVSAQRKQSHQSTSTGTRKSKIRATKGQRVGILGLEDCVVDVIVSE